MARVAVTVLAILALCRPARADDIEAARQHYASGSKAFDLGLYDDAVKEYMAAYDAKPDPALLYNIAQAQRLGGHAAEALRFYRVFLMRLPDAPNADEVRRKIDDLQHEIDRQRQAQSPPLEAPRASTPANPPAATVTTSPTNDTAGRRPRTEKIAGLTMAGVGVAALAAGVALSVVAKQDSDQLTMIDQQHGTFDPAKDSTGRTLGTTGPILIAVGGAAIVAGGVVALIGYTQGRRARSSYASTPAGAWRVASWRP